MSQSHGNTPAAWTAVSIMMVGFVVGAFAVVAAAVWLFWVGVAIIIVGAVSGKVLAMMGLGAPPGYHDR
jgi:phosphatidylglycerophosphate synthase